MLQRIQTVFLAGVVILGGVASFLPILEFVGYDMTAIMNEYKTLGMSNGVTVLSKNMGVGVLQGIVILISLVIIFLFKNRQLQIKLAKLNILLLALQIAAIVMYADSVKKLIGPNPADVLVNVKMGAIIPIVSLILTYLAIYFIKKDDKLVRAADRLR